MPTLEALAAQKGNKFKKNYVKEFIVDYVAYDRVYGTTHWLDEEVTENDWWYLRYDDEWERIEPDTDVDPEAVEEPPQSTYAYLAAQHGIVIIADGVTYDGTKQ